MVVERWRVSTDEPLRPQPSQTECHIVGLIAAGIGGIGSLIGGALNSGATKSAANTESNAAVQAAQIQAGSEQQALQQQLGIYNNTVSNLAPFLSTGQSALSQLSGLLGIGGGAGGTGAPNSSALYSALSNYPGYQFTLQQGLQANAQSEAARGVLNSGANIRNATAYGQGLASSQIQNYLSQLSGLGSLGENAGAITGNAGSSAGYQIGSALTQGAAGQAGSLLAAGQAQGAGILGSNLALTGGLNGALNSSLLGYMLSQQGGGIPSQISVTPNQITGGY